MSLEEQPDTWQSSQDEARDRSCSSAERGSSVPPCAVRQGGGRGFPHLAAAVGAIFRAVSAAAPPTPAAAASGVVHAPQALQDPQLDLQQAGGGRCTTQDPLRLVLDHLSGPDGSKQLYNTAARGLHRTSRHYQAEARATLRHLHLVRFHRASAYWDPSNRPAAMPWGLIAACPAVTSWTLHLEQLGSFTAATAQQLAAAAGNLRCLRVVKGLHPGSGPSYLPAASDAQQEGLVRLLWACHKLEAVELNLGLTKPWHLRQPHNTTSTSTSTSSSSTSSSTDVDPPLPLRTWRSTGLPFDLLSSWFEQHKQLRQSLTDVAMCDSSPAPSLDCFAALPGLKELGLIGVYGQPWTWTIDTSSPTVISSSLTLLWLPASAAAAELACGLTGLQDLSLMGPREGWLEQLPSSIAALKQLTALDISDNHIAELQPDLGVWLTRLQRLTARGNPLTAVPATLTGLVYLDWGDKHLGPVVLTLPSTLGRLQELSLRGGTSVVGLSTMTALQSPDVKYSSVLGGGLAALQPLTRLRRLDMTDVSWDWTAHSSVIGRLQQLTYLPMATHHGVPGFTKRVQVLDDPSRCLQPLPRPLPNLRELAVSTRHPLRSLELLGPWLSQLVALTRLSVWCSPLAVDEELLYLPAQLQALKLGYFIVRGAQQLPRGLTRLTALHSLDVRGVPGLRQLPPWLSELCRLEVLEFKVDDTAEQEVLAHMPLLRRIHVQLPAGLQPTNVATILGRAMHLHVS